MQDNTNTNTNTNTDQARQSVNEVAGQTKQAAEQVTDQARQAARTQAATRKDQAAQGLSVVSSAVRDMSDKLRQSDQTSSYAQYADQAAHQIQRFSGYLRDHDVRQVVGDVEGWVRRDPALALGGAFVLGLVAARFLKSSGVQTRSSGGPRARYTQGSRYSDQQNETYYRYSGNPDYYSYDMPDRPARRYSDEQYRSPATGADEVR